MHHCGKGEKYRTLFLSKLNYIRLIYILLDRIPLQLCGLSFFRTTDAVGHADRRAIHGESDLRGDVERRRTNRGVTTHTPS